MRDQNRWIRTRVCDVCTGKENVVFDYPLDYNHGPTLSVVALAIAGGIPLAVFRPSAFFCMALALFFLANSTRLIISGGTTMADRSLSSS
jgi:hypothetical protein